MEQSRKEKEKKKLYTTHIHIHENSPTWLSIIEYSNFKYFSSFTYKQLIPISMTFMLSKLLNILLKKLLKILKSKVLFGLDILVVFWLKK